MIQKIKKIGWAATSAALTLPAAALAQWDKGLDNAASGGTPGGTITDIVKTIMNFLLLLVGFLGVIGFVISGILYLTSAGDEERIGKAKKALVMSIIGVVVALIGFVVIKAVNSMLQGDTATF